jgi:hypothetical protein
MNISKNNPLDKIKNEFSKVRQLICVYQKISQPILWMNINEENLIRMVVKTF